MLHIPHPTPPFVVVFLKGGGVVSRTVDASSSVSSTSTVCVCVYMLQGLCHRLAEEKGLAHAQLPIAQFLQLKSRKVLTLSLIHI